MSHLSEEWRRVEASLPSGWRLDRLHLEADDGSNDWLAVAVAPNGSQLTSRAPEPVDAVRALETMARERAGAI